MKNVIPSGAVIVSTPQDVALIDVRKGVSMFKKISVPVGVFFSRTSSLFSLFLVTDSYVSRSWGLS